MDISMDTHMDTSIDIHMDMSMDIHMEMPIKSKVSKLDGLYSRGRGFISTIRARSLPRPAALEQQPECRRPDNQ